MDDFIENVQSIRLVFDSDKGPLLGSSSVLEKTAAGFVVPPATDLVTIVHSATGLIVDGRRLHDRLTSIARSLNSGEITLAAITTGQLRFRSPSRGDGDRAFGKASADDPKRPGWPAKTPGGLGGKFRPKDGAPASSTLEVSERATRLERLKARRGVRAVLVRVMTAKRLARLALETVGEFIPFVDVVDTAAMIEDIAEIAGEIAEGNAEIDTAVSFVEQGPKTIEELSMAAEDEAFASFDAFKKADLEKRFGPAGKGYEYHHIVEQSAAADGVTPAQLNATSNIVRIPKLLHEEINALYAVESEGAQALRLTLKGKSFEEKREAGLAVLRRVGVLYP